MIGVRHLFLAGIVAASVAACDVSESPNTTSAPTLRTACDADAATGAVFTTAARPDMPFTLQLPQLRGWQVTPMEGRELALRRADRHAGRTGNATVTLDVSEPRNVADNISVFTGIQGDWQHWRTETVEVCRRGGYQATGILPASGVDGVDQYHEFIGFDYLAGEMLYPIRMSVEATAADRDTYQPDIDTFVDGLQVVPAS
ncbi:hypothetical protein [Nocardia pseudobrasiliensis]|uniref:hypothetical protein n=1 Tax=Nocardia pseudobrasiliensis TaxID=45979 RepID=UPI0011C0199C|nr:hypothetical protein [Nocardia pseudobrasiliensis]